MINKISQSFIKDARQYFEGDECGLILKAKYADEREIVDQETEEDPGAKELGSYIEFMVTGAIPRNGKIPVAQYMPSDPKKMTAEYRLATINAKRIVAYLSSMGLKVIKANWKIDKGRFTGTIDIVVEFIGYRKPGPPLAPITDSPLTDLEFDNGIVWHIGDRFVIDMKYSGLMGDKAPWGNKFGWKWSPVQKKYHGTQAKQYTFLSGMPVYFLVTQSNNKEGTISEIRLFYTPVDEFMIEQHISEGNALFDKFTKMVETGLGLIPRPSLVRCSACPLKLECTYQHTFPNPELIDLNID
jgi:hypothetical protein